MSAYNTAILADTPVLYATLDDTSGTSCVDSSTTAHNGTYTGSPTKSVTPLIATGTAVTFSGSGQYVEFTTNAAYAFSGSLTCEAWIKTSTGGTMSILNGDDTGGARVFQFRLNAGKLEFITFGGAGATKTGSVTVNDNAKHYVVAVYDRSAATIKLYVDGTQDGTTATSVAGMNTTQTPLQIAERLSSGSHGQLYTGTIDEAAVYGSALSGGQVTTHYQASGNTYTKAGWATVGGVAAGVESRGATYEKANSGIAGIDGSGADAFTTDTLGHGVSGLVGSGPSASIAVDTGFGVVGLVGAGDGQLVGTDVGSGHGSVGTVGSGSRTIVRPVPAGRVLIAWDDGPLEPSPSWTSIDQAANGFPDQFVAGYDIKNGRQTLLSQTDTGTATVYVNDHELGLFDDRNMSSPYQGKLSGRQIMLQLYNPVTAIWEPQFRGLIDDYHYDIDGSASDANGDPINASIQIECVDMFDYLNGFGLTPGLAGVTPPAGAEDGVYYAATAGTVDDRIIEILTDAGIDPDRYLVASGNVKVIAVKYDPGESALTGVRDAADAEFPFIANIYVDRYGNFAFRGRYSRFNPDEVAAEPGSDWDFTRWAVGDETAILADPARAQMRVLSFSRSRAEIINVAMCWPQSLPAVDMPDEVFADTSSITAYGQHSAPPMSDLLTAEGIRVPGPNTTGKEECFLFAKLLVKNKAFPREAITALQVKAISPDDYRADKTWAFITRSDISHIVNVAVGYPGGTGFTGDSPRDDYYIEGRALQVRPLNPIHDYVEYNVEVSPAVWSMDTDGVFPSFSETHDAAVLTADFVVAE